MNIDPMRKTKVISRIRRSARQLRAEMIELEKPVRIFVSEGGLHFESKAAGLAGVVVGTFTREIPTEDLIDEAIFTAQQEGIL